MSKTPMVDLHNLSEDDRIDVIGKIVEQDKTVAIMVDDEPGKPQRYISKVIERYPNVMVLDRVAGPVKGVTTIKFGKRPSRADTQ